MPDLANVEEFEKEWIAISEEVIRRIFESEDIQRLKNKLRSEGHLTIEDRSDFINIVDKIKYDVIFRK
jgi:hypothetical protein